MNVIPSKRNIFVGLVVLVGCVMAQEYAVRFALPDYDPAKQIRFNGATADRPSLGVPNTLAHLIKNSGDYNVTILFNQYGFRDRKDVATAGAADIEVVGDSFALGWGVEENETFAERLSARLDRRVFNLGAPGDLRDYSDILDYVRRLGARSDDVVLAFNMSNDILDYDSATPSSASIVADKPSLFQHVKGVLTETSALYFLTTSVINRSETIRTLAVRAGLILPLSAVPVREVRDATIAATIDKLKSIAANCRLKIILIPSRGQWIGERTVQERDIHARFVSALRVANLEFLDMTAIQERGGDPVRYFFTNDGHWRPAGHELAAEALAHLIKGEAP